MRTGVCPECGKENDHLIFRSALGIANKMTIDGDGYSQYEDPVIVESIPENIWKCPKCKKTIAHSDDKALEILNQKEPWSVS